jgi:L1 cell adhesion molecule like protein
MFPREISFTNLLPNHTGVYQCEASNIHGTILANANIDVIGEHTQVVASLAGF